MSVELEHLKRRIRSIAQIQKVTSAMQKVATARLALDRRALLSGVRFTEELQNVVAVLEHELQTGQDWFGAAPLQVGGTIHLLCFGSERGLCGGFNNILLEHVRRFIEQHRATEVRLTVLGTMLTRKLRRAGIRVERSVSYPTRAERTAVLEQLAENCLTGFRTGTYREVHLLFMRFVSALQQVPMLIQLLPLHAGKPTARGNIQFSWEPSPAEIVAELLPLHVRQQLQMAFLHSATAENAARQTAMNRATSNAGQLLVEFRIAYCRLRQESITSEMLELVRGGFAE